MRAAAVGAAATATGVGGSMHASQSARAIGPESLVTGTYSGVAQLVGGFFGDDDDEILEREANELHDEFYQYAVEREPDDRDALESMKLNADLLSQEIRRNAAFVVAEGAQQGLDKNDVLTDAQDEIESTVRQYQERLIQRWERHVTRVSARTAAAVDEEELSAGDVWQVRLENGESWDIDTNGNGQASPYYESTWVDGEPSSNISGEYADGDSFETYGQNNPGSSGDEFGSSLSPFPEVWDDSAISIEAVERDGGDRATVLDAEPYKEVWEELSDLADDEIQQASTLLDLLYDPIQSGDVDAHEVASGAAIIDEVPEEMENFLHAAAPYRAIGMPEGIDYVTIETGGVKYEGALFWTLPSEEGLPVGEEIDPDDQIGEFHAGLEVAEVIEDDNDVDIEPGEPVSVELTEPFTVTSAGGESTLLFDQVQHIEPDEEEDHEGILEAIKEAFEQREETRRERQEIIIEEETNVDISLPSLPDLGIEDAAESAFTGLLIIGAVLVGVAAVVSNLFN